METLLIAQNKSINSYSLKELKQKAPSAFSKTPAPFTSKRYAYVSTVDIIKKLESIGFIVTEANQLRFRDEKNLNLGFQKHFITLYHPDFIVLNKNNQVEEMLEIRLVNSHNGSSKFSLFASFLRLACDNGMLALSNDMGSIVTKHIGGNVNFNAQEAIDKLKIQFEEMLKVTKKMKSKFLTNQDKLNLAQKMAEKRFFKQDGKFSFDVADLIKPIRKEDKSNSLWTTYNIIQEKLIKGFDPSGEKTRKVRKINHLEVQMIVNRNMFNEAISFL